MNSLKKNGREGIKNAKIFLPAVLFICLSLQQIQADTVWVSGHHEINDGDVYGEIWMENDATADMWGGDVFQLGALDSSKFNMFGGTMDILIGRYDSIVNIHAGDLSSAGLAENAVMNLYAYDVVYHVTGGGDDWSTGWLEGKYYSGDEYFVFDFSTHDASQLNIIPEPMTLLFLALGFIGIRKRN
jgi:hypothetical protein